MEEMTIIAAENRTALLSAPVESRIQQAAFRLAESDCPVLILGEQGAGKRTMATWIHAHSKRSTSVFQEIQCLEASAEILQAAICANGTLYLSEITDLDLSSREWILDSYYCSKQPPACRLLFRIKPRSGRRGQILADARGIFSFHLGSYAADSAVASAPIRDTLPG